MLMALRVGDGIGAALLWPALFSRMGHLVEDEQRQNAMSLLNIDTFYRYLVSGTILLIAVLVDQLKNRRQSR